jgi:cellulose synthase/poly-beta-1,6-N-acetylglucosamine synthase-like glycosyltransferase
MLIALIPAHNEELGILDALSALRSQTRTPDRIIVVADNCTDNTVALSLAAGVEVFQSVNNVHKKAGALNQALADVIPSLSPDDHILVQDADTVMAPVFLETAVDGFKRPNVGAVGGIFYGDNGGGLLGLLQRNEYQRYGLSIARKNGAAMVLSGTSTVFKVSTLNEVAARRGTDFPGTPGQYYDTLALTEDNEITVAIKTCGFNVYSPSAATVVTEVMPSIPALWKQRMRWTRGALENLRNYGYTRTTAAYFKQQVGMSLSIIALTLCAYVQVAGTAMYGFHTSPVWVVVTVLFSFERTFTVRKQGKRSMLVASLLFVELAYDMFGHAVFLKSSFDALRKTRTAW